MINWTEIWATDPAGKRVAIRRHFRVYRRDSSGGQSQAPGEALPHRFTLTDGTPLSKVADGLWMDPVTRDEYRAV